MIMSKSDKDVYMYKTCATCNRKPMCDAISPKNMCNAYVKLEYLIDELNTIEKEIGTYTNTCNDLSEEFDAITKTIKEKQKNS